MILRTELEIPHFNPQIAHTDKILMMGSCFSYHIGELLSQYKFEVINNPFGTIYNPIAICHLLNTAAYQRMWPEALFLENQGVHRHYWTHSDVAALTKASLQEKLESLNEQLADYIRSVKWITFTMGTAIAYELPHGEIVANCHKMPSQTFKRRFLSCDEIVEWCMNTFQIIKSINPDVHFLLTVSPVRHLNEGIEDNQISKSILRLASHYLTQKKGYIHYFPSYELMMDDLRDYRFYKADMMHPTDQAVAYIWDKFVAALIDTETHTWMKKWEKIVKAINHKPFFVASEQHQRFIRKTLRQLEAFSSEVDITAEQEILKAQLQ